MAPLILCSTQRRATAWHMSMGAARVDREDPVPFLDAHLEKRPVGKDAGEGDQNVDLT